MWGMGACFPTVSSSEPRLSGPLRIGGLYYHTVPLVLLLRSTEVPLTLYLQTARVQGASSTWPCTDFLAYWVVVAALGNLSQWIVICLAPKDFLITQGPILKPFINHPLLHVHLLAAQVFFSGSPPYKGGAFLRASQASIASTPWLGCLSRCLSKQHLSTPHSDPNLRSQSYK